MYEFGGETKIMSDYFDIYNQRLNRYGIDYQSRILGQRQKVFDQLLLKSIYRVDFEWKGEEEPGILEPYKQDETKTLHYLLTRTDLILDAGSILEIPDKDGEIIRWMVYYYEQKQTSGYNRYIMLRMTHLIKWVDRENNNRESWAYFYGQENNMLKDELKSRSRNRVLYVENLKMSFFIMPINEYIQKDIYFEIGEDKLKEAYVVKGYDRISTPGVEYVSVDPQYIRNNTPAPTKTEIDDAKDFYWLTGGEE